MGPLYQLLNLIFCLMKEIHCNCIYLFIFLPLLLTIWVSVNDNGTSTLIKREKRLYGDEKSLFHLLLFLVLCGYGGQG